jgi:hypothetical protein
MQDFEVFLQTSNSNSGGIFYVVDSQWRLLINTAGARSVLNSPTTDGILAT